MKFNFKKISAITASVLMVGMSMGVAAAANYPAPFVAGGAADVAIVYGANANILDAIQAGSIQTNLQSFMSGSSEDGDTVTGETAPLFSGGTKIYINDSVGAVKNVLTKSSLPTVLGDGSFSGNVDATFTQKIDIATAACNTATCDKINFAKQPTSEDDPTLALTLSTSQANYLYNATITFNKAINFSHADSEGEELEIFGSTFTIGSATDTDTLVLLKSAEKVSLDSDNPSAEVTIAGEVYTIELVSASDTSATIKVTNSAGESESKEVTEAQSKKINGITIAVSTADETNLKLSATIIAGSDKITIEDGSTVTVGEGATIVDGTLIDFGTGNPNNLTTLTISVYASDSDLDAIKAGESFTDPVFGTFKVDFSGFNIDSTIDSTDTSREQITFSTAGDDKIKIKFLDHRNYEKSIQFAKNYSTGMWLTADDNGRNITVQEGEKFHRNEFVVVGNEDEGYLLELTAAKNQTGGVTGDKVTLKDVFSGSSYDATLTDDGTGTVEIGGKVYSVTLEGIAGITDTSYNVTLGYPDGSGSNVAVVYPTIETSKGAKVMFYEPKTIRLTSLSDPLLINDSTIDGGPSTLQVTDLKFPNGADGYTSVSSIAKSTGENWTFSIAGTTYSLNLSAAEVGVANAGGLNVTVGQLKYNIANGSAANQTWIRLYNAAGSALINWPAVVIFEEKDDNANYEALIVEVEDGLSSDDGIGIDTVEDTWSNAAGAWSTSRYSDSKKTDRVDLWGSWSTTNSGDSDQKVATISYPDEQIYANVYVGDVSSSITGGTTGGSTQLGEVIVKDSEVSSVSTKNLIVIGGSCINSAAATLLGGAYCSADFTTNTNVGSGQFLLKGYADSTLAPTKLVLLVAGYEAADTVNAATYLRTQTVDTDKEYLGTSSTTATLVTTEPPA
ncbi:hypothetical protein COU55_03215 [Candidatus Pacearchaeota archaeon CG10_big_fil_rev_8_21_14_0_10_31_59]|nr:MAG: hypothetical protein COU55_03215 [Candidatus Pacearchaeota archaeon CG10_big_fil_rev_8_21_14_0_10_31_59]